MIYNVLDSLILLCVAIGGFRIRRSSELPAIPTFCAMLMGLSILLLIVPPAHTTMMLQIGIAMFIGYLIAEVTPKKKKD